MIKTKIRKTEKGHQVGFTIGHQTFFLQEQLPEDEMTSLDYSKWYEKQLKLAFKNLSLGGVVEESEQLIDFLTVIETRARNHDEYTKAGKYIKQLKSIN